MVLFPRTPVTLHIFEERYKEMIGEAIDGNSEFGIVLANDKGIMNKGCTGTVERVVQRYSDGRLDIVATGRRRFEIHDLDNERSFLRGEVEFFDDDDPLEEIPGNLRNEVLTHYKTLAQMSSESSVVDVSAVEGHLSFQVAQVVEDVNVRQLLLVSKSESERLRQLATLFPTLVQQRRRIAHAQLSASTNGHGKTPLDL